MVRVSPRSKPAPAAAEDSSMVYSYGHMLTLLAVIVIVFVCTIGGVQKQLPERQFGEVNVSKGFIDQTHEDNNATTGGIDLTGLNYDKVISLTGELQSTIKLPQAVNDNRGMVIRILVEKDTLSGSNASRISLANSGATVLIGSITTGNGLTAVGILNDAQTITTPNNAKRINIQSNDAQQGGGAKGSHYTFTYAGLNKVFVSGVGLVTGADAAPTQTTAFSVAGFT